MRIYLILALVVACPAFAREIELRATDTVTGIEVDPGDVVKFTLHNGQTRTLSLEGAGAQVITTNLRELRKAQSDGGTLYLMRAELTVDGHPLTLLRYVGSQESFADPYVVNGMRLWLDAVSDALALMTDDHGGRAGCTMSKRVRLAINDARDPLAPVPLSFWIPMRRPFIDIADSYNGDDPYMGAYQGAECHAGLDIDHPKGSPLFAPIDIDDHYYFDSLAKGDNNNRWRGVHRWPNGDTWTLQSHHMVELLIPEHTPFRAGSMYGKAAGVLPGSNEHSHFVFRTRRTGEVQDLMLDPWMLFWQMFQQEKDAAGAIRAAIQPSGPVKTGRPVKFSSEGTRRSRWGYRATYQWTFGDGGFSLDENPTHIYARSGIYPVTLTFEDGVERAAVTHLVTVDGAASAKPPLILTSEDDVTFTIRRPQARDTYGLDLTSDPHMVWFTASGAAKRPPAKIVNASMPIASTQTEYDDRRSGGWLTVEAENTTIRLTASAEMLTPGLYSARVFVEAPEALESRQVFRVTLDVRQNRPPAEVVVDDAGPGFYATPFFWTGHRFRFWRDKGYKDFYLTNGGRTGEGEFVRFTPNLRAGKYEVSFVDETPFGLQPDTRFRVVVKHKGGREEMWVEPNRSRRLGTFVFYGGTAGYVELYAAGSRGQVLADAVRFHPAQ